LPIVTPEIDTVYSRLSIRACKRIPVAEVAELTVEYNNCLQRGGQ
jgi:hypothetical protein